MLAAVIIFGLIEIAGFAFFYLYIVGPVRRKLEKDIIESLEKDLNALVTEFNRSAVSNVELIEERINRLKEAVAASKETEVSLMKVSDKAAKRAPVKKIAVADDAPAAVSYGVAAYRSSNGREEKDVDVSVRSEGVREESVDIQARIVSLFDAGIAVPAIAERVQMTRGEVEVVLGLHGKL